MCRKECSFNVILSVVMLSVMAPLWDCVFKFSFFVLTIIKFQFLWDLLRLKFQAFLAGKVKATLFGQNFQLKLGCYVVLHVLCVYIYSWRLSKGFVQGILKGEVSLCRWPPVWLVWNQLYENWKFYLQNRLVKQEVNCTVILPPLVFPGFVPSAGVCPWPEIW